MARNNIPLSVSFKMAFAGALLLTIFSAVASIYLATRANPNDAVNHLIATFDTTWKMGCGAFFGLLGGKTLP
jgi:hypothetical protein